jgi:pyrimidine nucleoside transport protein
MQHNDGTSFFRWDVGKSTLGCIGQKVNSFLSFTDEGSQFLYGYLVNREPFIPRLLDKDGLAYNVTMEINAAHAVYPVIMFKAITVIYFFSFVVSMLSYYGIVQVL